MYTGAFERALPGAMPEAESQLEICQEACQRLHVQLPVWQESRQEAEQSLLSDQRLDLVHGVKSASRSGCRIPPRCDSSNVRQQCTHQLTSNL